MKRYERVGFSNFVVYDLGPEEDSFDLQMLAKLSPSHIPKAELRYTNGDTQIYYHIERLQLGSVIFQKGKINAEMLSSFLNSMVDVLKEVRELLLDYDDLVVDLEQMFWDSCENHAVFVYVPGYQIPIWQQVKECVEQLLPMVSATDQKAMECIYNLYQAACEDMLDLKVLENYSKGQIGGNIIIPERVGNCGSLEINSEHNTDIEWKTNSQDTYYIEESVWKRILKRIFDKLLGAKKGKRIEETAEPSFVPAKETDTQTTVLSVEEHVPMLKHIDGTYPAIRVKNEKVLIGRQDSVCDYIISESVISRIHASLETQEGNLVVMDLNSANGTYVNEKRIETKEAVPLQQGDRVTFGNIIFVVG